MWIGVALAAINLLINLASGAMKFPILPLVFVLISAVLLKPWYLGAGIGLLAWTFIEGAGELFSRSPMDD